MKLRLLGIAAGRRARLQASTGIASGLSRTLRRQAGQGMVEYALVLVLISIVVIVLLLTMGKQLGNVFSNITRILGTCTQGRC